MNSRSNLATVSLTLSLFALLFLTASCGNDTSHEAATGEGLWTGDPTVQTSYGMVKGFNDEAATLVWKAIPFAKPPVGALRWKAPHDPDPWDRVREETAFSEACTQYPALQPTAPPFGSEDCLYLNIWRPRSEERELPVYVWIHGGGNSTGSADYSEGYFGANLSTRADLVFVSVHYRLGPLGWFTHPALRTGEPADALDDSGNYGTLDLIQSLEWIAENIEAFGGDPENVILAGESAGGINILSLLIAPPAEGLFHKAISMSGARRTSSVAEGDATARAAILRMLINDGHAEDEPGAEAVLDGMPLPEVAAYLRSRSAAELLMGYESAITGMISFSYLFRDGAVIPEGGYETLETGEYPGKVPVILGTTKDEQQTFLLTNPAVAGNDELREVVATYGSDLWKADGVDEVALALRAHADQPGVYAYQFLWGAVDESGESVLPPPWGSLIGAGHSIDIPFFLANDVGPLSVLNLYTEENHVSREALTDAIVGYQAAFARTGDPNVPGAGWPEWQPWTNGDDLPKCLLLDADIDGNLRMDMSTVALTTAGLEEAMRQNVPEPLYSEAKALLDR